MLLLFTWCCCCSWQIAEWKTQPTGHLKGATQAATRAVDLGFLVGWPMPVRLRSQQITAKKWEKCQNQFSPGVRVNYFGKLPFVNAHASRATRKKYNKSAQKVCLHLVIICLSFYAVMQLLKVSERYFTASAGMWNRCKTYFILNDLSLQLSQQLS